MIRIGTAGGAEDLIIKHAILLSHAVLKYDCRCGQWAPGISATNLRTVPQLRFNLLFLFFLVFLASLQEAERSLFKTREKFFNEDVLFILMKEVIKENRGALDGGLDECCTIAESMIEEIHQIAVQECSTVPFAGGRHKGSFKKRLLRQIKQARKAAMM